MTGEPLQHPTSLADQHYRASTARSTLTGRFGLDLLRALFLLNGIAALVLLIFITGDNSSPQAAAAFKPAIRLFGVGILWAAAASVAAFLCQGQYAVGEEAEARDDAGESPRQGATYAERGRLHANFGHGAQALAIVLALLSLLSFWRGLDRGLNVDFAALPHRAPQAMQVTVQAPPAPTPPQRVNATHCTGRTGGIVMHVAGDRWLLPTCDGRPARRT